MSDSHTSGPSSSIAAATIVTDLFVEIESIRARAARKKLAGRNGVVFDAHSLSTDNNIRVLYHLARELKFERSLEIGMALGVSCLAFAHYHRERGGIARGQHVAIDPFESTDWDDVGRMELERMGLSDYVEVREDFSSLVLPELIRDGATFGLIYVDGSHLFEDVFVDLYFCSKLLSAGGVILFDDSSLPAVRKMLRFIDTSLTGIYEPLDLSKYRPGGPTLKYRIARWCGKTQLTAYRKVGPWPRSLDSKHHRF